MSGFAADWIYRRGHWKLSRRLPAAFGFGLATVTLVAAAWMPSAKTFVLCFALTTFGADLTLSPSWTVCSDVGRKYTGTLSGAMNMLDRWAHLPVR
jgi:ACS family glucarate transporter-like MFS transporter